MAIAAVGDCDLRLRWMRMLAREGFVLPVLIHPTAVISPSAQIGYGSVIEARATVGPSAKIGAGSVISSGATVDRGVVLPEGSMVRCGQVVTIHT